MNKLIINKLSKILERLKEEPEKNKEHIERCIEAIKRHEEDRKYWIKRNNDYKNYNIREDKNERGN
ncbi:TPA: hypothetical protein ACN31Q_000460 [Vibrio campbellii]